MQTILQISPALHLIALAMAVGVTLANAAAFKQFCVHAESPVSGTPRLE